MATVVPCASCYGSSSLQHLQVFGKTHGGDYMSLFAYRFPRGAPRPRLAYHAPNMTLRQICRMLRIMRQLRNKEAAAAAAAAARKQGSPPSSPTVKSEKRCLPACFRRRRTNNIKRVS